MPIITKRRSSKGADAPGAPDRSSTLRGGVIACRRPLPHSRFSRGAWSYHRNLLDDTTSRYSTAERGATIAVFSTTRRLATPPRSVELPSQSSRRHDVSPLRRGAWSYHRNLLDDTTSRYSTAERGATIAAERGATMLALTRRGLRNSRMLVLSRLESLPPCLLPPSESSMLRPACRELRDSVNP